MKLDTTVFHRPDDGRFTVEYLSDGSVAVFDVRGDAVHSLNPSAAAVWECCAEPLTAAQIVELLSEESSAPVGEPLVLEALHQLERAGIVVRRFDATRTLSPPSRREALRQIVRASAGAAALPLVLTLTAAEQRLYAQGPGSPALSLTGTWTGTLGGEGPVTWNATQTGNSVTGPITVVQDEATFTGTLAGTLTGTSLALTLTIPPGGFPPEPTCSITGTGTSPATTNTALLATLSFSGTGCSFDASGDDVLDLTKT